MSKKDEIVLIINNVRSNIEEGDTKKSVIDEIAVKLKDELKLDEAVINSIPSHVKQFVKE